MTNYYEFNKHEYYALIKADVAQEAFEVYVKNVAGESVEEVLTEGIPDLLTPYDAFVKYGLGYNESGDASFAEIYNEFNNDEINLLLIDGSLL